MPGQEAGVGRLAKREQWPPSVLRRVFSSLLADSPRSLLEREVFDSLNPNT